EGLDRATRRINNPVEGDAVLRVQHELPLPIEACRRPRGEGNDRTLMPGAGRRRHPELTLVQLVAAPVVWQTRIVSIGQVSSCRHGSLLRSLQLTPRMVAVTAQCRQCPPLETVHHSTGKVATELPIPPRSVMVTRQKRPRPRANIHVCGRAERSG